MRRGAGAATGAGFNPVGATRMWETRRIGVRGPLPGRGSDPRGHLELGTGPDDRLHISLSLDQIQQLEWGLGEGFLGGLEMMPPPESTFPGQEGWLGERKE